MFSSISSYLFGSCPEEGSENLAEVLVTESNGADWVLVNSEKQVTNAEQDGDSSVVDSNNQQGISTDKPEDDPFDEDKENDSLDDASSISSMSESSSSNDYDSESELRSYLASKSVKKVKKSRKPRIIIDDQNGFNAGIMDGSWFVTPPPCFIRHKKSKKRQIPSSPMEDMLIEHPSISVYQANTSSASSASSNNASNNSSANVSTTTPFDYLIEAFDYFPSITAISKNITWLDWGVSRKSRIPTVRCIHKPSPLTQRKSSKKNGRSNRSQSSQQHDHKPISNSSIFNMMIGVTQPHASREFRTINNSNQHDTNEYLHEINNLQYNLAPMQKAINQGSQKFLKKSFLNRQNLVKFRSDRQRFTQRPKFHPLKMC